MKKLKRFALWGALASVLTYAVAVYAYPMPGDNQEVYVEYYSNSARTNLVGTRAISQGASCQIYHTSWGVTTSYSRVIVANCIDPNGM